MIFRGETSAEWYRKNHIRVERWERQDAPKIALIEPRWRAELEWHSWFAWFPVTVGDGETAWLETVERKLRSDRRPTIMAEWQLRDYMYRRLRAGNADGIKSGN